MKCSVLFLLAAVLLVREAVSQTTLPPMVTTNPPTTEAPTTPTTEGPMTTVGTTAEPTTQAPPVAPVIQPEDSRLIFREPEGCVPSECDIFIGINNNTGNSGYLDIFLEGEAAGYVAVGFSDTADMPSTDVVVCVIDPSTGMIVALDAWNVVGPTRNNIIDPPNSQDVELWNGAFTDQRISCTVSKRIAPTDENDLNLNADLFLLYARFQDDLSNFDPNNPALVYHGTGRNNRRVVNDVRVNPVIDENIDSSGRTQRESLTRAHGILMLISWILLGVSGIFFAAWMRPALPNGEWFQVHRVFMVSSLVVGVLGFILIFIANKDTETRGLIPLGSSNPTGTAHFAIGIFVMALHIANPIISIFRCHPGKRFRWIFNLLHGTMIGLFAELFAITNCGIGLSLFGPISTFGDLTVFWVYIAFVIFFMSLVVVMIFIFTVTSLFYNDGDERGSTAPSLVKPLLTHSSSPEKTSPGSGGVELAVVGGSRDKSEPSEDKPKLPSKDAPLRWLFLGIFLAVLIPIMIALIVMVAI